MSYTNGKISETNVSISDVKSAIGASSNDLGTLCKHGNIKRWAKYKPVKHSEVGSITDGQRASVNWGLLCSTYTNSTTMSTNVLNGGGSFSYVKPTGGAASPYRLGDFRNYYSEAKPPVGICYEVRAGEDGYMQLRFTKGEVTDYTLKLGELTNDGQSAQVTNINGWYMGVCIVNVNNTNERYTCTARLMNKSSAVAKVSDMATSSPFLSVPTKSGRWYVFAYATNVSLPDSWAATGATNNYFLALEDSLSEVNVSASLPTAIVVLSISKAQRDERQVLVSFDVAFNGSVQSTTGTLRATFTLYSSDGTNRGTASVTFHSATSGTATINSSVTLTSSMYVVGQITNFNTIFPAASYNTAGSEIVTGNIPLSY